MLVLLLLSVAGICFAELETCERDYVKYGCFKRNKSLFPDMLANNRDSRSSVYTGNKINWKNFQGSLHDLACKCAKAASENGYEVFAIGFYGECHAGKSKADFEAWAANGVSNKCIGADYGACNESKAEECTGGAHAEYVYAFLDKAPEPINGGFTEWSEYTACSASCGAGIQERERHCTNPLPQNGGSKCAGESSEVKECQIVECPVDGGYSDWEEYSKCSASCGGGSQSRSRSCNNPAPAHGGKDCEGQSTEEQQCNENPCPVNGGFTDWSDYGACSQSCGSGSKTKTRSCTNPQPANGGADCVGAKSESLTCNAQPCLGAWDCEWKYTPFNDDGGSNGKEKAAFLDRHQPNCGEGKALNSFRLERNSDENQYRYKYKCCSTQLPCTNKAKENRFTGDGAKDGDPTFLDRQDVNCGNRDQYLSFFHLKRNSAGNEWAYEYKCCEMTYPRQCVNRDTGFQSDGGSETVFLDRHDVSCPNYYGLSRFRLVRNNDGSQWRYDYTCCRTMQPSA